MLSELRRYRLGPFWMASEMAIPELAERSDSCEPRSDSCEPDVWIRVGKTPERIAGVVANETLWWASPEEYLQWVPGVAKFLVRRGREIVVEPAAEAIPGDIRAYLLAPIFSCLCFQAGLYALHASAVRGPAGAIAFLGHSGAGKSTLAAFLERRGFPVVSDDLCLLGRDLVDRGEPVVYPVAPALKLWPSALAQLGASPKGLPQVWSREEKFRMRLREVEERIPLGAVVFLEWEDDANAPPALSRVSGVDGVARLMGYMHFEYIMKAVGRQVECFEVSARILRSVPAYTLRRPRNFARMESVLDSLVEQLGAAATRHVE